MVDIIKDDKLTKIATALNQMPNGGFIFLKVSPEKGSFIICTVTILGRSF